MKLLGMIGLFDKKKDIVTSCTIFSGHVRQ